MTESTGQGGGQVMWGVALMAPICAAAVLAVIELLNAWGATSWSPLGSLATSAVVVLALPTPGSCSAITSSGGHASGKGCRSDH